MEEKSTISKLKSYTKLMLMAGVSGFKEVEIPEIPMEWEQFPNTGDEWCGIKMPNSENSSACLYKGKEGSVFKPHKHINEREHITIMNVTGKIRIITEKGVDIILEYPSSFAIDKDVYHACEFLSNTVIMCVWHPMFKKGWKANFKEEKK